LFNRDSEEIAESGPIAGTDLEKLHITDGRGCLPTIGFQQFPQRSACCATDTRSSANHPDKAGLRRLSGRFSESRLNDLSSNRNAPVGYRGDSDWGELPCWFFDALLDLAGCNSQRTHRRGPILFESVPATPLAFSMNNPCCCRSCGTGNNCHCER
jgi:hypothetical protein